MARDGAGDRRVREELGGDVVLAGELVAVDSGTEVQHGATRESRARTTQRDARDDDGGDAARDESRYSESVHAPTSRRLATPSSDTPPA